MATKNLSRTVIEGGRHKGNKYDRRQSHREERAYERQYIAGFKHDDEFVEARPIGKKRKVRKGFSDKLGPVRRFLRSKVGKPWDDTLSEIMSKFDTRNIAGRHVVYDHMLRDVEGNGIVPTYFSLIPHKDLWVGEDGILQGNPDYGRRYYGRSKGRQAKGFKLYTPKQVWEMIGYSRIIDYGSDNLFWASPTEMREIVCDNLTFSHGHQPSKKPACPMGIPDGRHTSATALVERKFMDIVYRVDTRVTYYHKVPTRWRQGKRLTDKDKEMMKHIPYGMMNQILVSNDPGSREDFLKKAYPYAQYRYR